MRYLLVIFLAACGPRLHYPTAADVMGPPNGICMEGSGYYCNWSVSPEVWRDMQTAQR
jgi:hypothetical protein